MTPDPLKPPNTDLANPADAASLPPASVRNACRLIIASLALGVFTLLTGIRPDAPGEEPVPAWVTAGIVMVFGGLTIWLAAKTHQGRNWARWALLGYLMLGWWLSSSELTEQFMRSPLVGFIDVLCIGMELAACGLLFGGQSAAWFTDLARTREPPGR